MRAAERVRCFWGWIYPARDLPCAPPQMNRCAAIGAVRVGRGALLFAGRCPDLGHMRYVAMATRKGSRA